MVVGEGETLRQDPRVLDRVQAPRESGGDSAEVMSETPDRAVERRRLVAGWASALAFLVFLVAPFLLSFSLLFFPAGGDDPVVDTGWQQLAVLAPAVVAVAAAVGTLGMANRYWHGRGRLPALLLWAVLAIGSVLAWFPISELISGS